MMTKSNVSNISMLLHHFFFYLLSFFLSFLNFSRTMTREIRQNKEIILQVRSDLELTSSYLGSASKH